MAVSGVLCNLRGSLADAKLAVLSLNLVNILVLLVLASPILFISRIS